MHVDKKFDIDYIDCSSLDDFARCPFKYMLSRCLGAKKGESQHLALEYGTLIHKCLPLCFSQNLDDVLDTFDVLWEDLGVGEDDPKRNKDTGHLLLENFYNTHNAGNHTYKPISLPITTIETEEKTSDNEIPFLVDIGGKYPLAGRIDMPVVLDDGTKWALDFKTSSEISERFFWGFENHPQAPAYTLALSMLTGENIHGLIIDAIRVSPLPKRATKVPPNQWFPVHITETKLEWFIQWANSRGKLIDICNKTKYWPRNMAGCSPYSMFGMPGYSCPYKSICNQHPDKWQNELRFWETGNPWHPFVLKSQESDKKGEEK